jgi:MSHA biogenesis protein MshQ
MKNSVLIMLRRLLKLGASALVGLLISSQGAWGFTCTSTGGNWTTTNTWTNCNSTTPQATDTVVVNSGTVNINTNATVAGITVNGGTVAIGTTNNSTAWTVNVNGNITVASGASLIVNNRNATYTLNVTGNITNNGVFDLRRDSNSLCIANFTGAAAQTIDGSSAGVTEFYNVTATNSLTINKTGAEVTQTGTLAVTGNLTIQAGMLSLYDTTTITGSTGIGSTGTLNMASTTGTRTFTGAVTLNSGGTWSNTTANATVTLRGGLTHNGAAFNAGTGLYTFDTNAQAIGGSSAIAIPSLTVTGVTLTNSGTLTVATALSGTGGLTNSASGSLNIGGSSAITTLTASAAGNTVNYTGAAQTVKAATYHHLGLSGSGTKTLTGVSTVNGNLSLSGTVSATTASAFSIGGNLVVGAGSTFSSANFTNSVTGTTSVSGTLAHTGAAAKTYVGAVTMNTGGVWTNAGNALVNFRGGLTHNGSTFTSGTGIYTFDTNAQSIGGASALTINNLTITGVTLTNNGTLTVGTALSGTGELSNGAGGSLNIGGTAGVTTLTATATGNSVNYTLAGAQTVKTTAYYNLSLSGSGAKSLAGSVTVAGTLTLNTATLVVGSNTLTLNGPAIAGTPANLTTTASSSLVFGGSAAGVSLPGSVTALNNLTVNNGNGISLGGSAVTTVLNGTLTLGANQLTTLTNTLSLATNCSTNSGNGSLSRTSGYVLGNLQLTFLAGSSSCVYHVGDSASYAPVTVDMVGATAGTLTGRADAGDHPDTVASSSGIDSTKSANHYWKLTTGTLTAFTSYSASFQFCSTAIACPGSGVDAAANTANFVVARKSAGAWTTPAYGTRNVYSTQATGITSANGFGEFAVGEQNLCFTASFTGADGSAPSANWSVGSGSGAFGSPVIFGNRLRLTDASAGVSTWATLNRLIPAASNKVTVEFDHYAYGGGGGDGIAVVLSNASVTPTAGAFGGSMGYAQKSNPGSDCTVSGGCPGFAGGWLGIALDEYGNFSNPTEGRYGGTGQVVDSIAVRGSGVGVNGYAFLKGTPGLTPGVDGNNVPPGTVPHRYRIIIDNTVAANTYVSVERDTTSGAGTAYTPLIAPFDVKLPGYGQSTIPTNFNLSFTGSSGTFTNAHEIGYLSICTAQPLAAPSLHHIQIDHGGSACTSTPNTVTVKACADAACTALYAGSVTVDLTPNAAVGVSWSPTEPVTFTGGSVDMALTITAAGTVTLGGGASSPVVGNATRCFNGATETCALVFSACTFDAVESGAAAGSPIFTKLANVAFNLDAKRLGGNQTLSTLELVDASSGTCSSYAALSGVTITPGLPSTFNGGTTTKTFNFTYNNAAPNVRVRLTNSGGVKSCSNDNFAIRPQSYNVTSTATNSGSSGAPVFRAGEDAFNLTATAVYGGAATTTGYNGIPRLNASLITAPAPQVLGNFGGSSFPAATSGVSTASFTYDEVGNFNLGQYAIYDDNFAAVDSVNGECTPGFSNTLDGNGKYSCQFGSSAAGAFGRFVPHHFTVTGTVSNACTAGGFTYMGQAFALAPTGVVQARNKLNGVTSNYSGAYASGTVTFGAENADNGSNLAASVVAFPSLTSLSGSWSNGTFSLSNGTAVTFARPAANPSGPFDALDIGLTVTDASVSTSPQVEGADMNPSAVGGTLSYKKFSGSPLKMRFGRLRLLNAFGSERMSLPMQWETQYWSGQVFVRNTLDSCTSLSSDNISLGMFTAPPGATAPLLSGSNLTTGGVTVNAINAGLGTLTLAPTGTATGSVTVLANLGSRSTSDVVGPSGGGNCTSLLANPPTVNAMTSLTPTPAGSALPYLNGRWCGANYDQDPLARASFGVFKSPLIYRRENY